MGLVHPLWNIIFIKKIIASEFILLGTPRPSADSRRLKYKNMNPQKITTLEGILCRSVKNRMFFRVYNNDGTFTDYDIAHSDLKIQILGTDGDAFIYETSEGMVIDHSPQTLGLNEFEAKKNE